MSYQTWVTSISSGETRSWKWMLLFEQGKVFPFPQQPSATWRWEKKERQKTPMCWIRRKTRITRFQKLFCLSVPLKFSGCSEVVFFRDGLRMYQNLLIRLCLNKFVVCMSAILFSISWKVPEAWQFFPELVRHVWDEDSSFLCGTSSGSQCMLIQSPYWRKSETAEWKKH